MRRDQRSRQISPPYRQPVSATWFTQPSQTPTSSSATMSSSNTHLTHGGCGGVISAYDFGMDFLVELGYTSGIQKDSDASHTVSPPDAALFPFHPDTATMSPPDTPETAAPTPPLVGMSVSARRPREEAPPAPSVPLQPVSAPTRVRVQAPTRVSVQAPVPAATVAAPTAPRATRTVSPTAAAGSKSVSQRTCDKEVAVEVRRPLTPRSYRERLDYEAKRGTKKSRTNNGKEKGMKDEETRQRQSSWWNCTASSEPAVQKKRRPPPQGATSPRGRAQSIESWQHAEEGRMLVCYFSDESPSSGPTPRHGRSAAVTPSSGVSQVYVRYS